MTDRIQEIKQRNAKVRGFNTELDADWDWLITEAERYKASDRVLGDMVNQQGQEIERLRDGSEYWGMNQELAEQITILREAIECMWQIIPDPKDDRFWTQELATELADMARKALTATEGE